MQLIIQVRYNKQYYELYIKIYFASSKITVSTQ